MGLGRQKGLQGCCHFFITEQDRGASAINPSEAINSIQKTNVNQMRCLEIASFPAYLSILALHICVVHSSPVLDNYACSLMNHFFLVVLFLLFSVFLRVACFSLSSSLLRGKEENFCVIAFGADAAKPSHPSTEYSEKDDNECFLKGEMSLLSFSCRPQPTKTYLSHVRKLTTDFVFVFSSLLSCYFCNISKTKLLHNGFRRKPLGRVINRPGGKFN